jgi:hypothetical protein
VEFEKALPRAGVLPEDLFLKFPTLRSFYEEMHIRMRKQLDEYACLSEKLSRQGIDVILIKSGGYFPHEVRALAHNLDMLVRSERLSDITKMLKENGYEEMPMVREPHKFLFRNKLASLPLHIHTRVEWEGAEFVNSEDLWNSARVAEGPGQFLYPSPENVILITTAHFFFENHEIRFADLDKVRSCMLNNSVDWDHLCASAKGQNWLEAFLLAMALLDKTHQALCGRGTISQRILEAQDENGIREQKLFLKMLSPFNNDSYSLLRIPYLISALFFMRKLLHDQTLTFTDKLRQLNYVISDVLRRRTRPY